MDCRVFLGRQTDRQTDSPYTGVSFNIIFSRGVRLIGRAARLSSNDSVRWTTSGPPWLLQGVSSSSHYLSQRMEAAHLPSLPILPSYISTYDLRLDCRRLTAASHHLNFALALAMWLCVDVTRRLVQPPYLQKSLHLRCTPLACTRARDLHIGRIIPNIREDQRLNRQDLCIHPYLFNLTPHTTQ